MHNCGLERRLAHTFMFAHCPHCGYKHEVRWADVSGVCSIGVPAPPASVRRKNCKFSETCYGSITFAQTSEQESLSAWILSVAGCHEGHKVGLYAKPAAPVVWHHHSVLLVLRKYRHTLHNGAEAFYHCHVFLLMHFQIPKAGSFYFLSCITIFSGWRS